MFEQLLTAMQVLQAQQDKVKSICNYMHEKGLLSNEEYKELARNNYQIDRHTAINSKFLETLGEKI